MTAKNEKTSCHYVTKKVLKGQPRRGGKLIGVIIPRDRAFALCLQEYIIVINIHP